MLFPTKERASVTSAAWSAALITAEAPQTAEWLSKTLNCEVGYLEKDEIFLVLEVAGIYVKILCAADGKTGWIICSKFIIFEEVK